MRWWKVLGLAGFVGVAATGAVIARAERRRRAYTPEEIRDRLHARVAESNGAALSTGNGSPSQAPPNESGSRSRSWFLFRKRR